MYRLDFSTFYNPADGDTVKLYRDDTRLAEFSDENTAKFCVAALNIAEALRAIS